MSEEKRLDEKTLEEVTGGTVTALNIFITNNCTSCGHLFSHTCPYGGSVQASEELGNDARCPKKVAL